MYEDHLNSLKMMIEALLESTFFYGLYCEGSSGIGKTTLVSTILEQKGISFETLSSYSTPLNFFNCLHTNRDGIVLLDDCKGIIENSGVGISLLKAALSPCGHSSAAKLKRNSERPRRILRWGSTSGKAVTNEFEFHGRLIIISNSSPSYNDDVTAFKNRCLTYRIFLDKEERLQMLARVSKTSAEKAVYKFLECNADALELESLNYRTLYIGASLYKSHERYWEKLFLQSLDDGHGHPMKVVIKLSESELTVEQQFLKFHSITKRSRASFFRYREQCGIRKYSEV
jgi:hypothetical protein